MTKQERVIVSAYTGFLMCNFGDMHEYIEKIMGRPVWTHELAMKPIMDEIKRKTTKSYGRSLIKSPSIFFGTVSSMS